MTKYSIIYTNSAAKSLRKLDPVMVKRILRAISLLQENPRPVESLKLKNGLGERRIRVGDYRVVYEIREEKVVVLVLRVGHRREVYKV